MVNQPRIRVTVAEFEQLPETNQIVELIEGEIIVNPPPLINHQGLAGNCYRLAHRIMPGGKVFFSPIGVFLDEENIPEPDVVWVAPDSRFVIGKKYIEGGADLIVEIISPSTERQDRVKKFNLYQKYGVREYWIVDPDPSLIEVWSLVDGKFVRLGIYEPGDTFSSPVLGGQNIDVSMIFAE